ncbi:MAG: hypothetical protein ABJB33_03910 [Gemmatimonadota bacterium]
MPAIIQCQCGHRVELKDEYVGRSVSCPRCGTVNVATAAAVAAPATDDPAFARDKFLLKQKVLTINEQYDVADETGKVLLFVERPTHFLRSMGALLVAIIVGVSVVGGGVTLSDSLGKGILSDSVIMLAFVGGFAAFLVIVVALSPKRHVTFYRDEAREQRVLEILQDKKFQPITATYTVRDPDGRVIGLLRKNFLYNIFRKRWLCLAPDGSMLCMAIEDSLILSLLRRFLGPFFGLLRTNFIILWRDTDTVLGEFNRKFTLLDRYVLDLSDDRSRRLDRRIALALGVMLDTGERR